MDLSTNISNNCLHSVVETFLLNIIEYQSNLVIFNILFYRRASFIQGFTFETRVVAKFKENNNNGKKNIKPIPSNFQKSLIFNQ
jgi:hypothetical protein